MTSPQKRRRITSASPTSMKLSSSSSFTKYANFSEFPILWSSVDSLWAEECEDIKLYDLLALIPGVASSSSSEDLCSSFFEKVVRGMKNVVITVRKKVPQFATFTPCTAALISDRTSLFPGKRTICPLSLWRCTLLLLLLL